MSCMSPYSIPLWTILTKCPEPDWPTFNSNQKCLRNESRSNRNEITQSQHGSPSALAAIFWNIGLTCSLKWMNTFNQSSFYNLSIKVCINPILSLLMVSPCFFASTRHQWRTIASSIFTTWNTSANVKKTLAFLILLLVAKTKNIDEPPKKCSFSFNTIESL